MRLGGRVLQLCRASIILRKLVRNIVSPSERMVEMTPGYLSSESKVH